MVSVSNQLEVKSRGPLPYLELVSVKDDCGKSFTVSAAVLLSRCTFRLNRFAVLDDSMSLRSSLWAAMKFCQDWLSVWSAFPMDFASF